MVLDHADTVSIPQQPFQFLIQDVVENGEKDDRVLH